MIENAPIQAPFKKRQGKPQGQGTEGFVTVTSKIHRGPQPPTESTRPFNAYMIICEEIGFGYLKVSIKKGKSICNGRDPGLNMYDKGAMTQVDTRIREAAFQCREGQITDLHKIIGSITPKAWSCLSRTSMKWLASASDSVPACWIRNVCNSSCAALVLSNLFRISADTGSRRCVSPEAVSKTRYSPSSSRHSSLHPCVNPQTGCVAATTLIYILFLLRV